jgi:NAD-dependent dihydropyrimidine dehydrogenase PreA subunit
LPLLTDLFADERERRVALAAGQVVCEAERCVQCGICAYDCPVGIDVRSYAWRGLPIIDNRCIRCGECVRRCPRGTLSMLAADAQWVVATPDEILPLAPGKQS